MANDYFNAWELDSIEYDEQLYELYEKIESCIDSDNIDSQLINSINNVLTYLKDLEKKDNFNKDEYLSKIYDFIFMLEQCFQFDEELMSSEIKNIIEKLLQCEHRENIDASEIFEEIQNLSYMKEILQKFVKNYLISNSPQTNNILTYKDKKGAIHYNENLARDFFYTMFNTGEKNFLNNLEKTDILNRMLMYQDENSNICRGNISLYSDTIPSIITKNDVDSYLSKDYILPYPVIIEIQNSSDLSLEMIKKLEEHGMKIEEIIASREIFTKTSNENPFNFKQKYSLEKYMQDPSIVDKKINETYDILSKLSNATNLNLNIINLNELLQHDFKLDNIDRLLIKDISNLSIEDLEELENLGIKIQNIEILNDFSVNMNDSYNVETYKKCRRKIDEYISEANIDDIPLNIPNREKIIFGRLCKLMSNITYDYSALSDENKGYSSRDLTGSLLEGTCVCLGYAELMKNIFACCGIECNILISKEHAWNQIKLDDIWYNLDYTQLPTSIRNLLEQGPSNLDEHSKSCITDFLLQDDNSFPINSLLTIIGGKINECSESIPLDELITYLIGDLKEISKLPVRKGNPQNMLDEDILDNLMFDTRSSELSEAKEIFTQSVVQKQEIYSQKEGGR